MGIKIYVNGDKDLSGQLERIEQGLARISDRLISMEQTMSEITEAIAELKLEVTGLQDASAALVALFEGFIDLVEQHKLVPGELSEIITNVRQEKEDLIAAALKGTNPPA